MDRISIQGLEVYAKHGVYPEENTLGQKFVVSVDMYMSTRKAGLADDLSLSVNYGEVCHFINDFMTKHTWKLLETVAERLAQALLSTYTRIEQVDLKIEKPWAPIGLPINSVSVSISRKWHTAYIALGSNMGDKKATLIWQFAGLRKGKTAELKKSPIIL